MISLLFWAATAHAADPLLGKLPSGVTPSSVFAAPSLTTVGTVTGGQKSYTVECGTLQGVKTCAVLAGGKEVARSTNIVVHTGNVSFSIVFDAGDGFAYPRITWD